MGHAGIAPIEEGDTVVFEQNISIVEIAVVDRFRNPKHGEVGANSLEAWSQVLQPVEINGGQSLFPIDHQAFFIREQSLVQGG